MTEKEKEEILKKLLKNLLEERLSRLEKRNNEQTKDIKLEKDAYNKQELLVKKLCSIKIEPKKLNQKKNNNERNTGFRDRNKDRIRDKTPNNLRIHKRNNSIKKQIGIRSMTPDVGLRKKRVEKKDNTKTDVKVIKRPAKNNNKIPSYMMNTSSNANKSRISNRNRNNNNEREKISIKARTPDIKKRTKNNQKKINKVNNNIETNLKLIDLKIEDMKEHIPNQERISEKVKEHNIEEQNKEIKPEETENINGEIKEENKFDKLIEDKIIESISSFLDKETRYNFYSCNKKLIKYIKNKLDDTLAILEITNNISESQTIQDQINSLKLKYEGEQFEKEPPKFVLSKSTVKAIEFLNKEEKTKLFYNKELLPPLDNAIFIYKIFFQFLKDNDVKDIKNDHLFWIKASDYIIEKSDGKVGDFFKNAVDNFEFTAKNIFEVKKIINGKEDQLKPASFSKICPTTGLIVFLIKDTLEYCGIILSLKKNIPSICLKYLEYIKEMQDKLKNYIENIREWSNSI